MSENSRIREAYAGTAEVVVVDALDSTAVKDQQPQATWLTSLGWKYDTVTAVAREALPDVVVKYLGDGIMPGIPGHPSPTARQLGVLVASTDPQKDRAASARLLLWADNNRLEAGLRQPALRERRTLRHGSQPSAGERRSRSGWATPPRCWWSTDRPGDRAKQMYVAHERGLAEAPGAGLGLAIAEAQGGIIHEPGPAEARSS